MSYLNATSTRGCTMVGELAAQTRLVRSTSGMKTGAFERDTGQVPVFINLLESRSYRLIT